MRVIRIVTVGIAALPIGAAWAQCEVWMPQGTPPGLNGSVQAITHWDADGPGPQGASLVVTGNFTMSGTTPVVRVARWTGAAWEQCGPPLNAAVSVATTWDADGPGPQPPSLVVAGTFSQATSPPAQVLRIAVLAVGAPAWQSIGNNFTSVINALRPWDPDGAGPLNPLLVVGGAFTTIGATAANRVAAWDGVAWQPLGTGADLDVRDLTTWDPDGPGPLNEQLVICGGFGTAGGVQARYVARWDGSQWHAFGPPTVQSGTINKILNWDADGAGPFPGVLVIAGFFPQLFGGAAVNSIAFWDGLAWSSLETGIRSPFPGTSPGNVSALGIWDADGPGPDYADLVVTGSFGMAGSTTAPNIARWDGVQWRSMGQGPSQSLVVSAWDPDASGAATPRVMIGGTFATAGGLPAGNLASYGCPLPCYPDCDASGALTIADFACFQSKFAAAAPYADCDASGALTIADFGCFQTKFVTGCP